MKLSMPEQKMLDAIAEPGDLVDVQIEDRSNGQVLYVNVNGVTVVRIGRIDKQVEVTHTVNLNPNYTKGEQKE